MFWKKTKIKKLIITHPDHGHLELTTAKDIETEFNKIMKEGYGNKIPAVFHAEKTDGSVQVYSASRSRGQNTPLGMDFMYYIGSS